MSVSNTKTFTQAGHGFTGKEAVYFNGTAWVAAQANASSTLAEGLVDAVAGNDITIYIPGGHFWTQTSHGLGAAGLVLYVSAAAAGVLVTSPPGTGFVQQVGQIIDADTLAIQSFSAEVA